MTILNIKRPYYSSYLFTLITNFLLTAILTATTNCSYAQQDSLAPGNIKKMSLEELFNLKVTSVSKRSEKLSEVASAIQVITREDIIRSGATNIPEALRLSPNLQVAQIRGSEWIISARGFNAAFSNKLLVLINGRTVYSPLFAGVFWDAQNVLLEDVDRIEIISGPGGSLWGANAVNGVINIITKSSKDTKRLYLSAAAGSFLQQSYEARYGGQISSKLSYRIFAQHFNSDNTFIASGKGNSDSSNFTQAGFRVDYDISAKSNLAIYGNVYYGVEKTSPSKSTYDGQNILARWTKNLSDKSDIALQVYVDRTWRHDIPSTISDQLNTYDFDFQHNLAIGNRNKFLWGVGYRFMVDETQHSTPFVGFLPNDRNMELFTGFAQDEIEIVPGKWKLTAGAKLQHNTFSGFEVQPSVRIAWTPNESNTIWAAVSRAIRAPSRIDVDYHIPTYPVPPTSLSIDGGPNFVSEKVVAWELGYRVSPGNNVSLSLAAFYNQYNDLYSVELLPGTLTYQIQNGVKGHSMGVEFSGNYQVCKSWRVRGGYTYFYKKLENKPGHFFDYSSLGIDPKNQFLLQSILNLPAGFQLDIVGRYIDSLPVTANSPHIPSYITADARVAWQYKKIEISFVGKNLFEDRHTEIATSFIPRNFYIRLLCRL
jgi:iron complex outermembrane receptor protein